MSETVGRTLRAYQGERGGLELSYSLENGEETWTLLDNLEGHRNFTSAEEATAAFDARLERRERKRDR